MTSASRIDYALLIGGLVNATTQRTYEVGYKTDHSMYTMVMALTEQPRGPGYWKFNKNLLHDKDFIEHSNCIIKQALIKYSPSTPDVTGRERLIRSHSSARFCFELSGNSN